MLPPFAGISWPVQTHFQHEPERRPPMPLVDLRLKRTCLLGQRHRPAFDVRQPFLGRDPGIPGRAHRDRPHVVVRQPPQPLPVFPYLSIESDRSDARAEPDHALFPGRHRSEIVVRQTVFARVESPILAIQNAHALRTAEPKPPARIEHDAANVHWGPTTISAPGKLSFPFLSRRYPGK